MCTVVEVIVVSDEESTPVASSTQLSIASNESQSSSVLSTDNHVDNVSTKSSSGRRSTLALFSQPYKFGSTSHRFISEAIIDYLLADGLPLYTVEKPGFKRLIKQLDSRWVLVI